MTLSNLYIVLEDKIVFGDLVITDGLISNIIEKKPVEGLEKHFLIPGFIDVHIHGSNGFDAMDISHYAIEQMALSLVKEGTTGFLATTMTQSVSAIENALQCIKHYYDNQNPQASSLLGIHLEGPFINPGAAGAQPESFIINPDVKLFEHFMTSSGSLIKKVSFAPELDGANPFMSYLKQHGIIGSIAHTKATYQDVKNAIDHGVTSLTHTYNQMTPLHHRDIGVVGAAYLHDELNSELIFDKIHVSVEAAKILLKNKTYKGITLITDSMRAKYLKPGISELGGQKVIISDVDARLENGSLAGSILKMIDAYKNVIHDLNVSPVEASYMASVNPAKQLNMYDKIGSIEVGKRADLLILDDAYNLEKTYVNGQKVFEVK